MESAPSPSNVFVKNVKGTAKPKKGRADDLHRRGLISTTQLQKVKDRKAA